MFKFGKNSEKKISSLHDDLQMILEFAIKSSDIDFGISCGYRSDTEQLELYSKKLSNCDGVINLSKHQLTPAEAFDIYAYIGGEANYDIKNLIYIAGVILGTAKMLKMNGMIDIDIRWGGNWDMDNVLIEDQQFVDLPHFEIA